MFTEQFINTCCRLVVSNNKSIPPSLISDINEIVHSVSEKDIPLLFRKKYQFLDTITNLKLSDSKIEKETLIDNVLTTGYFKDINDYVNGVLKLDLTDEQVTKAIETIAKRKSLLAISKSGIEIQKYLDKLNTNGFKDADSATTEWKNIIGNVHSDIIDIERATNLQSITELDLLNDDYEPVINQIELSYSGANSISTGYDSFDKNMYGGFAPARLYMFCGSSGGGKSVMLINLVKNAVDRNLKRNDGKRAVYVYISLENLIDESLLRLYCCLTNKKTQSVIDNLDKERSIIPLTIKNWLNDNNATIKILYLKPQLTSCFKIMSECDKIKSKYPDCDIKALYIDYLDLIKPNIVNKSNDAYRLELGQVTLDMKTMAVLMRVPIVTATQVNRSGYDPKNKMNLSNISESMKKVDNSDWICMMQPREDDDDKSGEHKIDTDLKTIDLKITKSRFGKKDISIPFISNFSKFRFDEENKDSGLDIDVDLDELAERNKAADKLTQIQNGRYSDETEVEDSSVGFL